MALARQPALLVLDQPAALLDPLGKQEIQRALAELAAQPEYRLTIVLAERDADFLLPLVERLLGLASGRLALDAPANVAFADPDRLGEFGIDPPQLALLAVALAPVLGSTPLPVFRTVEDARAFLARVEPASSPHHELLTQATRDATRLTARSAAEPSRAALDASAEPVLQLERVSFRYAGGPPVLQVSTLPLLQERSSRSSVPTDRARPRSPAMSSVRCDPSVAGSWWLDRRPARARSVNSLVSSGMWRRILITSWFAPHHGTRSPSRSEPSDRHQRRSLPGPQPCSSSAGSPSSPIVHTGS